MCSTPCVYRHCVTKFDGPVLLVSGTKARRVPHAGLNPWTWLFRCVSCPNYTYETMAWMAFTVMTQSASGQYLFLFSPSSSSWVPVWLPVCLPFPFTGGFLIDRIGVVDMDSYLLLIGWRHHIFPFKSSVNWFSNMWLVEHCLSTRSCVHADNLSSIVIGISHFCCCY